MENTQIENTTDVIEDINEETLLSLDETLELDQEQTEIAEGKCKNSNCGCNSETEDKSSTEITEGKCKKEGEDMEGEESDEDEKEDEEECEDEMNEAKKMQEAEVSSDEEFTEYAKGILKAAHGDKYDEAKAMAAIEGILKKADGDYGAAVGMITSGLGEEEMEDSKEKEVEMKEETEEVIEENTISIDTSDITRLVESEEGLTEEFKEKASIIFETAVKSKIKETEETLKESYAVALIEEVETIKSELVEKIDNYLTYAVESWVEDNKVAIEGGLRTQIAENFIQSLKTVFVENYIEVPESKQDLVAEMESSISQLQNESAELENTVLALNEKVNSLTREKVISESTSDLADTQAEKLKSLLEDIECTSETSFRKKVATIKEFYLNGAALEEKSTLTEETESSDTSSYVTTETIVENETEVQVSPSMEKYLTALSRLNKATTANIPVVG
jgi:hypothetical protein